MPGPESVTADPAIANSVDLGQQKLDARGLGDQADILVFNHKEGKWDALLNAAGTCIYALMDAQRKAEELRGQGLEGQALTDALQDQMRRDGEEVVAELAAEEPNRAIQTFEEAVRARAEAEDLVSPPKKKPQQT